MISRAQRTSIPIILGTADAGAIFLAFSVALYLRFWTSVIPISVPLPEVPQYLKLMVVLIPVWLAVFAFYRLYDHHYLFVGSEEYKRVLHAVTISTMLTMVIIYLLKAGFARGWVLLSWLIAAILVLIVRYTHRKLHHYLMKRSKKKIPVIVVGANDEAKSLINKIRNAGHLGLKIVSVISDSARKMASDITTHGDLLEMPKLIKKYQPEVAIVVPSAISSARIQGVFRTLALYGVDLYIAPSLFDIMASRVAIIPIGDTPLINLKKVEFSGLKFFIKRCFDIVVSSILLFLLSPLFLAVAALIKLDTPGPVFFRQLRVGRHEHKFFMLKFRTMIRDAEVRLQEVLHLNETNGPIFKIRQDPRITRIGKFLRRFSIDELPQLINVLKGEMSLVGPRPPLPREVEKYGEWEKQRLEALPGMTGYWQISGRSDTSFEEMVKLDIFYIENWSLAFDFYILFRTIPVVLRAKGAY
jgi:exopolysaccharide biosynthesis polyprenyl glycosylphosphotransferase